MRAISKLLLIWTALTSSPALAAPRHVHLSWEGPVETSITVSWRSDRPSGEVQYGPSSSFGSRVTASSSAFHGSHLHHARLSGLKPGSSYHYRCGTAGAWSGAFRFTTATPKATAYRYVAFGDSRNDDANRARVRALVQSRQPAFSLFSGDFVSDGRVQSQWDQWFATMQPLLAYSPLMGSMGNHEQLASNYYQQFALPTHSPTTSGVGPETYYSFDYGSTHFVALSTDLPPNVGDAQYMWLKQDLIRAAKNPALRFTVVFGHAPPYTSGPHGNHSGAQKAWNHLFESFGVDLGFWGHDHTYERTRPMFEGRVVPSGGVVHVVTGGAGAPLYSVGSSYFTALARSAYHLTEVNVQGTRLKLEARGLDGKVFDSVVLDKPGPKARWVMDGALDPGVKQLGKNAGTGELKTLHAGFDGRYLYVASQGGPSTRDHFVLVAGKKPTLSHAAPWAKGGRVWAPDALLAMESSSNWSNWQDPQAAGALIPGGSTWKYHHQGQDLGSGWLAPGYDDSAWPSGPAQLGYGDGDERTKLTNPDPNYPSTYFRRSFTLSAVPAGASLSVTHDDGVAVWINGKQVLARYMGNGTGYSAWASATSSDNQKTEGDVTQTGGAPFVKGKNVICALVKQVNSTSSDLSFDLELKLKAAEQTGFSRASNPAWHIMEGLLDLRQRFGRIPPSVFVAAAAYGTGDGGKLEHQIPAGNGNGDLDLGEWIEFKLVPPPPPDGGPGPDSRPRIDQGGTGQVPPGTGGCGCEVASSAAAPAWPLLGFVLGFVLVLRRRR